MGEGHVAHAHLVEQPQSGQAAVHAVAALQADQAADLARSEGVKDP